MGRLTCRRLAPASVIPQRRTTPANRAMWPGPDSAAPADEAGPSCDPVGRELGVESRVPAPGVHRAVPALAEVRIHDGRTTRDLGRDPDGIQHVSRRRAVHSGCHDARATGQDGIRLTQWLARARRTTVDGVGEPGGQAELVQEWHQHFRLLGVGDGLHREQVRGGRGQQFEPASVEVAQRTWGDPVSTSVLRAVGQHRAVGADGRRDQESAPACGYDLVAHLTGQVDARQERALRLAWREPGRHQARHACLVARRRDHVGTGEVVVAVDCGDLLGIIEEQACSPQVGGEVNPPILEGVRQATIENEDVVDLHWTTRSRCRGPCC